MSRLGSRIAVLGLALVAMAAVAAGCGGSSHPASSSTPGSTQGSAPSASRPTSTSAASHKPGPSAGTASTGGSASVSAATRAELSSLKEQLDGSGRSLAAASAALAQSDPNQTKNEEGSLP